MGWHSSPGACFPIRSSATQKVKSTSAHLCRAARSGPGAARKLSIDAPQGRFFLSIDAPQSTTIAPFQKPRQDPKRPRPTTQWGCMSKTTRKRTKNPPQRALKGIKGHNGGRRLCGGPFTWGTASGRALSASGGASGTHLSAGGYQLRIGSRPPGIKLCCMWGYIICCWAFVEGVSH